MLLVRMNARGLGTNPQSVSVMPWQLWQASDDGGVERTGPAGGATQGGSADAAELHLDHSQSQVQTHDRQRTRLQHRAEASSARFHCERAEPEVGQ